MKNLTSNLKEHLITLQGFVDNDYLDRYCLLIERSRNNKRGKNTNSHHIVPRCWFKLNDLEIDNSVRNLVILNYRDHVMAHYYLCLCTVDKLRYANELALHCLLGRKKNLSYTDKLLFNRLPLYNTIYEDYKENLKSHTLLYGGSNDNKGNRRRDR